MFSIYQRATFWRFVMGIVLVGGFVAGNVIIQASNGRIIFSILWFGIGPILAMIIYAFSSYQKCNHCGHKIAIGINNIGFTEKPNVCPKCNKKT